MAVVPVVLVAVRIDHHEALPVRPLVELVAGPFTHHLAIHDRAVENNDERRTLGQLCRRIGEVGSITIAHRQRRALDSRTERRYLWGRAVPIVRIRGNGEHGGATQYKSSPFQYLSHHRQSSDEQPNRLARWAATIPQPKGPWDGT